MRTLTQIMHIVAKDARRFWPLVILVVGLLGLDLAFDTSTPRYVVGSVGFMMGGLGIRGVLFGVLTVLVTTLIVHEDEVASGQAFWSSRPISPLALLCAKVLFLGTVLLAVPLAFQAAAILEAGTGEGLALQLAQSALYQGGLLVLVMGLASVTKDLKSTIILGILGYVGVGLMTSFFLGSRFDWIGMGRLAPSREFVTRILWLGLGAIVLA